MESCSFAPILGAHFPFWSALTPEDRESLCRSTAQVRFARGTTLHDGSRCTGVILVRSGCLRIYMLSEEGREITLYRLDAGDVCILSASCALQSITFDVLVDAEEDSECLVVGGCAFSALAEREPTVKIYALEETVSRFSDVMWVMQQILFMSMDRRLAIFLLDEAAKRGDDRIRLTHEQIARYMGSAREVVSRMLRYFAAEGLVEAGRGGITLLDRARLRAMAG